MYHFLKSSRKVSKNLAQEGFSVYAMRVNNIINAKEKKARKKSSSKKQSKNPGKPLVRTKSVVKKVGKDIDCTDPSRQRDRGRKYEVSKTTVAHIIGMDCEMKYKKKQKTDKLMDKHRAQRFAWDQHSEDG